MGPRLLLQRHPLSLTPSHASLHREYSATEADYMHVLVTTEKGLGVTVNNRNNISSRELVC